MELSRQTCQTFDRDRNGNSTNKCGYKQDLATAKGFGDTKIIEWFGNIRMYYTFMPLWRCSLHWEIVMRIDIRYLNNVTDLSYICFCCTHKWLLSDASE